AIEGKVHSNDLATLTRQARLSPSRTGNTLEMILTVKVVLTNETLFLAEIVLKAEADPTTSKNRMVIPTLTEQRTNVDEEDLAMPWSFEEVDQFTPRIRNFKSLRKKRMPNNVKTYDGTGDLEDHVKNFQAVVQVERWAMPTWCHMFNSILIGTARVWFDELPPESIGGYTDLKAAFLTYFMQQKKYVKDPVEIHNIKQKDGETIEEFMERFKIETGRIKGAPECMRISGFMHGRVTRQKVTQSFTHVKKITFSPLTAYKGTWGPHVIKAEISGHAVHRIYVDEGSSMEALYEHCFNRLRPKNRSQMVPATTSQTGFSGETIWPFGQLRLLVTIGDAEHYTKAWMNFMIVRSPSPYNRIIGRLEIREIQAVPSTAHEMLRFPVKGEIVTIRSTISTPTECNTIVATPKDHAKKVEICHENFKVAIHPDFLDQEITIGGTVSIKARTKLCTPLKRNLDIFAWQATRLGNDGFPHQSRGIPFGLKNAGATYQRMVDKAFDKQIGQNLEIYMDDLVIKSHTEIELLRDIEEIFRTLRKINMNLNPKKCMFGVAEGMFLGYMINPEGIKPCPDKTEAVLQLPSPRTIKEVHSLNGKLASLNRFISKSAEKSLPLFKTLKKCIKKSDFHWTPDAEQAFKQLKQHLARLPMLVAPKPKEELIMYLSASYGAISAVLMTERDTVQTPVYFILPGASHRGHHRPAHQAEGPGKVKFLIVAMDNFTKWIEAKAMATIIGGQVKKFVWDNIVCRLGLPGAIVSDNAIREAKEKLKMTKYYNTRVRGVTFRPGDFVYHSNKASHAMDEGKLGPK
nr:reverse transcriptase domain-containing protein [Tanacetum cinerariifolium]